jgi:hypothetical protein
VDIEKALQEAKATLAIEGLELTKEEEDLIRSRQQGDLTQEQFLEKALEIAKRSQKSLDDQIKDLLNQLPESDYKTAYDFISYLIHRSNREE